jgi:hypothetical protein
LASRQADLVHYHTLNQDLDEEIKVVNNEVLSLKTQREAVSSQLKGEEAPVSTNLGLLDDEHEA